MAARRVCASLDLERVDSLPDLQRDFTQSQYKVMFRKSRTVMMSWTVAGWAVGLGVEVAFEFEVARAQAGVRRLEVKQNGSK